MDLAEANAVLHEMGATQFVESEVFDRLIAALHENADALPGFILSDDEETIRWVHGGSLGVDGEMLPYAEIRRAF
jgi:hypothetical protein